MFKDFEFQLFQKINREWTNSFLDSFFVMWTDVHKTLPFQILILFSIGYLLIKRQWRGLVFVILAAILASVFDSLNSEIIKPIFMRQRPLQSLGEMEVIIRGAPHSSWSFPSSHAVVSFFLAVFIGSYFKKLFFPLFAWAFLTGYSRVYCGVHFPGDVIAGAVLGSVYGYVCFLFYTDVERRFV